MANRELTFKEDEFIVSKTDLRGKITYGNALFVEISGYDKEELLYQPHNILRHPDMPAVVFKYLWSQIEAKKEVFAYVVNQTKNRDFYWVFAYVTASSDENGKLIGYHSARRKPKKSALEIIQPLYKELLAIEKSSGIAASEAKLMQILKEKGVSYDEFILSI